MKNGGVYDGEWKNAMRDGSGKYVWPDRSYYEGEWVEDKANGFGKLGNSFLILIQFMLMVIFMKDSGQMIWLMVEVFIYIVVLFINIFKEELDMKENGKMIYNMVKELKYGLMEPNMK